MDLQGLADQLKASLALAEQLAGAGGASLKIQLNGAISNIKIAQQWVKQAQGG